MVCSVIRDVKIHPVVICPSTVAACILAEYFIPFQVRDTILKKCAERSFCHLKANIGFSLTAGAILVTAGAICAYIIYRSTNNLTTCPSCCRNKNANYEQIP